MTFEVCILAGGLSSRMGRNKADIRLNGRRLMTIVKDECQKASWPVRVLRKDAVNRCGPIGGVFTALKKTRADVVLFIACDMPSISAGLLKRVAKAMTVKTAAVFTHDTEFAGFPFALRRSALEQVEKQIQSGDFSLQTLAKHTRARFIRAKASELVDIDTPADLAAARERLKS